MQRVIALSLALMSGMASAKNLPAIPADCAKSVAEVGYCSAVQAPTFKGPIDMQFFVVVDKSSYPTVDSIINRYLAFDYWPEFSKSTDSDALLFNKSARMASFDKDQTTIYPHYYDYKMKSPIGYIKVRGVTHNYFVPAVTGAVRTLEFVAQANGPQTVPAGEKPLNGLEGVKFQTGAVHAVDCSSNPVAFCSADQFLLVYETNVQPDIDLLPKVAAASIQAGIESLLVGMLFNDVSVPAEALVLK